MADVAPAGGVPGAGDGAVVLDDDDAGDGAPGAAVAAARDEPGVVTIRDDDGAGGDEDALPERAEEREDGSVRLPLLYPRRLLYRTASSGATREERFEEFVFHPLTGADMRAITAAERRDMALVAIARSTRVRQGKMNAVFDLLDARDAAACTQVVGRFFSPGLKTGR